MSPHTLGIIFRAMMAATLLFLVLISAAIVLYPGGTYADAGTKGYSWLYNFFSDLGRSRLYNGDSNTLVRSLFVIALVLVGAVFIPFFLAWRGLFGPSRTARVCATIGTVCGIVAGVAYVVVGVTPWDIMLAIHQSSVYVAFSFIVLMSVSYSIALVKTSTYPRIAAAVMIAYAAIAIVYLILLFLGPSYKTPTGLFIQVVGQKIIVLIQVVALFAQAAIAVRVNRSRA